MDLVTSHPFVATKLIWQAHSGAFALTVIVKATFVLAPGVSPLALDQERIVERDQFYEGDPRRSTRIPGDLVPYKPRADVLLVGHAYAPNRLPVRSLTTRLVVGDMDKVIEMRFDGSPTWPGRTYGFGSLSASGLEQGWNNKPLPVNFDPRLFQAAPPDQQLGKIRANERIVLENLHPVYPRLVTALPNVCPRAVADRATGEREQIALVGDTLWVDTDRGILCVVWRGRIGLRSPQEAGRIAVWADGVIEEELALLRQPETTLGVAALETTMVGLSARDVGAALPFVEGTSKLAVTTPSLASDVVRGADQAHDDARYHDNDTTGTMFLSAKVVSRETLPFEPKGSNLEAFHPHRHDVPVKPSLDEAPSLAEVPVLGYRDKMAGVSAAMMHEPPKQVDVAPPPMIGPIVVHVVKDSPSSVVVPDERVIARPESEPELAAPEVHLTIEQTACIAAELAEGNLERARVLRAHELLEPMWRENAARWDAAMAAEQRQGQAALRSAYDGAYVQRVEAFRGPITVQEYGALYVGFERRTSDATLTSLRIQRPALMPIMRVWVKKVASDVGLGKDAYAAIRAARKALV